MAPAYQADDNVVFLYHCLANAAGKIDWNAVAMATGSTRGAVEIRWRRLKKKIEGDTVAAQPVTATPAQSATTPPPQPAQRPKAGQGKKKTAASRKRKIEAVEDEDDEDDADAAGPPQVDGQVDFRASSSRRRTRGKKLNFNIKACLDSDVDSSAILSSGGDEDYVADVKVVKSEDDDSLISNSGDDRKAKAKAKRIKKSQPLSTKAAAPVRPNDVRPNLPAVSKGNTQSSMHPCDRPLPSIEYSPPATPLSGVFMDGQQGLVNADSEIALESLKPGMIITLPPKGRAHISKSIPDDAVTKRESSFSLISASSVSATRFSTATDSVNQMLQQELANHVEIRPEDSASNVAGHAEEDSIPARDMPTGKV
ncbi:hypothetical protein Z517_05314 [Fonsecaea pedrosoi CBS 271.37]|uniref:Myb-like DNA-binding domain-containing protein n=1 Tax=Fonsecaea pedrosoi CBS 271.37 TaxID=1442368 RepID=A0A0D2F6K7_9EURO|nr:uncharacterized protein Z517_05314 [Fonsecaea pedrosoi CBS 271.37]KIW82287.1 hypothetical protein Z517_05314 [Fonsecaea pedrosoi CBS 271.37]